MYGRSQPVVAGLVWEEMRVELKGRCRAGLEVHQQAIRIEVYAGTVSTTAGSGSTESGGFERAGAG